MTTLAPARIDVGQRITTHAVYITVAPAGAIYRATRCAASYTVQPAGDEEPWTLWHERGLSSHLVGSADSHLCLADAVAAVSAHHERCRP